MTEQAMGTAGDTPTPRLSELGVATCAAAQKAREVANMVTAAVEHITGMAPEAQPTTDTGPKAEPSCLLESITEDIRAIGICLKWIDSQMNRL